MECKGWKLNNQSRICLVCLRVPEWENEHVAEADSDVVAMEVSEADPVAVGDLDGEQELVDVREAEAVRDSGTGPQADNEGEKC